MCHGSVTEPLTNIFYLLLVAWAACVTLVLPSYGLYTFSVSVIGLSTALSAIVSPTFVVMSYVILIEAWKTRRNREYQPIEETASPASV